MGWFDNFEQHCFEAKGVAINARISITAPGEARKTALLLLRGFAQSHVMWHSVARRLGKRWAGPHRAAGFG